MPRGVKSPSQVFWVSSVLIRLVVVERRKVLDSLILFDEIPPLTSRVLEGLAVPSPRLPLLSTVIPGLMPVLVF